jgi:hypothetical protein
MSAPRCIDVPVSWLRLERYHLGEVSAEERAQSAAHLAACAACAESYASLERDDAVALPALPEVVRAGRRGVRSIGARARLGVMVAGGLALAAAAVLGVGQGWRHGVGPGGVTGGGGDGVKGDAIAFSLVREDSERIEGAAGIYRDGDRFKAVVTCSPSMDVTFDVVVYDETGASFPLAPARVACGNEVPLPGAFRLTGSGVETVCLAWEVGRAPERGALAGRAPGAQRVMCKRLEGAR